MTKSKFLYGIALLLIFCQGPILREFGMTFWQAIIIGLYTVAYGALMAFSEYTDKGQVG